MSDQQKLETLIAERLIHKERVAELTAAIKSLRHSIGAPNRAKKEQERTKKQAAFNKKLTESAMRQMKCAEGILERRRNGERWKAIASSMGVSVSRCTAIAKNLPWLIRRYEWLKARVK